MKTKISFAIAMLMTSVLLAHDARSPKDDIRARSEQRYPQIRELKSAGKVGENSDGFLEAVKSADSAASKLIDEENADRKALYKIIAGEQHITESVVAQRAAQRNFDHAKRGDWLKEDGKWKQK